MPHSDQSGAPRDGMTASGPVRVLQVLACDETGGTELMVSALSESLDPARVRSDVAALAPAGPIAARLRRAGVSFDSLGGAGLPRAIWRLVGLLHRRPYDVVNAYGIKASLAARIATRLVRPGATFICGVRDFHVTETEDLGSFKARAALALERLAAPMVDIYDANSQGALELLAAAGIDRDRLRYIPNGLDLSSWTPREDPGHRGNPPTILCVARFVPRKRHEDLIQAVALLRARGVDCRAVLVGDGPLRAQNEALVSELGLEDSVAFEGSVDTTRVRSLLTDAAVFCLVSLWEGMPGAVMEAMASAVPVVATNVNGTSDLIDSGASGLLVPPREPALLADALERVLADRDLARELGTSARARMEQCFSLGRMVDAKESLYRMAAGRI